MQTLGENVFNLKKESEMGWKSGQDFRGEKKKCRDKNSLEEAEECLVQMIKRT